MRPFQVALPLDFLEAYQGGVLAYTYRGIPCLKSPLDLAIYMRALWDEKPRTIIEIGSKLGAALFCSVI